MDKKMNIANNYMVLMMMNMVIMFTIISNAPKAQATITCGSVVSLIRPCLPYLGQGGKGQPSLGCCSGVSALNNAARTTPDRQTTCKCLKGVAASLPPAAVGAAAGIPAKCNVRVPFKISPSTDCSRVV